MTLVSNLEQGDDLSDCLPSPWLHSLRIERKVHLWRDLTALVYLIWFFRNRRFQVVHTLSPKTGLLGMVAARLSGVPVRIHVFQGEVWALKSGLSRLFFRLLDRLTAACATHLLVVSASERRFLEEEGVVRAGRLRLLGSGSVCGVDLERFDPGRLDRIGARESLGLAKEDKVVAFVGRINRDKGVLDLAKAFVALARIRTDLHLLVVGPDEQEMAPQLREICKPVSDRLTIAPYSAEPERFMIAANILCLPSHREGFGMVLLEAAALGLPTVASDIYGIQDAVEHGRTGLLFPVGDVKALANSIEALLNNDALCQRLGQQGQQRVREQFSSELVLSELSRFYESVLAPQKSGSSWALKRLLDAFLALLALALLAPGLLVLGLAVKLSSPGPVLYWSNRVGQHNRLFEMPKFRSMRMGAPTLATHLFEDPDRWLTPLGKFLRRTSLDELPQLWSILVGHMSFVGPRPALFNQEDLIEMRTRLEIHRLRPGLTGWAQINGRDDLPDEEKVRFDAQYLQRCSLGFDLEIMLKTLGRVIKGRGVRH